jgi:hypothetical protein
MRLSGIIVLLFFAAYYSLLAEQESSGHPHGKMNLECSVCHTTQAWKVLADSLNFDHQNTGFPLSGRHTRVACRDCHQILIFSHIGVACVDCHMDVHGGELGSECEACHSTKTWENRQEIFDQHSDTRFPLVGVHSIIDCESCHFQQTPHEYKTTAIECYQCHFEEYHSSKNPDHDCLSCHSTGFSGTPNMCEDCHIQDYQATSDPDHEVFGFPRNCEVCHNENLWQGTSFDHLTESGFALNGAHGTILCISCHVNNQVSGLPRDCFGCHEADYNSVDDPNHAQAQFSFDCLECHTEQSWTPATFDHSKTSFPLTGAHLGISCTDCHINGQYTGLPIDCFSCHENDYNGTADPNHSSAGFPVQCEDCHNTNNWDETTWDHDAQYFPIYTGRHSEAWDNCVECHVNPADYGSFECILCHEHSDQADLADKHKEEQDYEYDSQACYSCHPNGVADDD